MSGFGLTSRIIGCPPRRAGSRPEHSRGTPSPGRPRRRGARASRPARIEIRRADGGAGQVRGRPVGPLGVVGQDRPGPGRRVVDDLGHRQGLGLGQGEDADVELAPGQIGLDQDVARVARSEPRHGSDERLGRLDHAPLVDPEAGVLGLRLDDRRPGAVPGGGPARPGDRERGRRQARPAEQGLGPPLRVAERLRRRRAAGVGQAQQFEHARDVRLAAARTGEPFDQVEDDVDGRRVEDRPGGGGGGQGRASKPCAVKASATAARRRRRRPRRRRRGGRRQSSGRCRGPRPSAGALTAGPPWPSAAWRILRISSRVADPVPFGQDDQVARHRGQAGQGVGLDEIGDAVADPEVDPGEVATPEDRADRIERSASQPSRCQESGRSLVGDLVDPVSLDVQRVDEPVGSVDRA